MNDLDFVKKCTKGDKGAWDEFITKYSRLIYNYIHSILKVKSIDYLTSDSINDLFQEIFLLLLKDNFKKLRSFKAKNGCSLASWLRQVTVNATIDYVRKIRPMSTIDEDIYEGISLKDVLTSQDESSDKLLWKKEKLMNLKECIEKLGREDQYFLELHLNQGVALEELRDYFELSRGAVDMRRARIIDKLKECFKGKGFDIFNKG